jgi:hypothetical protein
VRRVLLAASAALALSASAHAQSPDFRNLFGPAIQANRVAQQRFEDQAYTLRNCLMGGPQDICRQKYPEELQKNDEAKRIYASLDRDCMNFGAPPQVLNWGDQDPRLPPVLDQLNTIRAYCADPEHVKQAHATAARWHRQVDEPPPSQAYIDCISDAIAVMPSSVQLYGGYSRYMRNAQAVCSPLKY